jgi:hypothetical protein
MTYDEAMGRIEAAAVAAGMQPARTPLMYGREALVGRTSKFKLQWMATRLHTFLVAGTFAAGVTVPELDSFMGAALQHASSNKGGLPRGFQTGVAAIVVAVTQRPSPEAVAWATKVHGRDFAAFPWPVLVDIESQTVTQPNRMLLGWMYSPYLKGLGRRLAVEPISAGGR